MKPHVLFISGRETGYIRNRVLIRALQQRSTLSILTPRARSTVGRSLIGIGRFLAARPRYDLCFAGFYGQPLAIALSVLQRKPIVLDAYVSTFDTLCEDRCWFRPRSPVGSLSYWLDRYSCKVAARVLVDTCTHAQYFARTFGVPESKLATVYVGCDEELFCQRVEELGRPGRFEIFYYGAFLPLHGTDIIVQAADLLRDRPDIHFTIGGDGPLYPAVSAMIRELELDNVDLLGWIPLEQICNHIARASLCLGGHFSTVPKAARVISTKTFQFTAMHKPTVVGDNPAIRELFTPGKDVYAVPMGDPVALADAIRLLADEAELRDHIAAGGYQVFHQRVSTQAIADQLSSVIEEGLLSS